MSSSNARPKSKKTRTKAQKLEAAKQCLFEAKGRDDKRQIRFWTDVILFLEKGRPEK